MDRGDEQAHRIPGDRAVMRGLDGDRFRQNGPVAIALEPSRKDHGPEALARVDRACGILKYGGTLRMVFDISV